MKAEQGMTDETELAPAPQEDPGMAVTMTFRSNGDIVVSDPVQAEPMSMPMEEPAEPSMRDGGFLGEAGGEEGMPQEGGQTFQTMDKAIRYLLQLADSLSPGGDEEEAMSEGYGEEGSMSQKGLM